MAIFDERGVLLASIRLSAWREPGEVASNAQASKLLTSSFASAYYLRQTRRIRATATCQRFLPIQSSRKRCRGNSVGAGVSPEGLNTRIDQGNLPGTTEHAERERERSSSLIDVVIGGIDKSKHQ